MKDDFTKLALQYFKLHGKYYRSRWELGAIYEFATWLSDIAPVMAEYRYWRYEPNKRAGKEKNKKIVDGTKIIKSWNRKAI